MTIHPDCRIADWQTEPSDARDLEHVMEEQVSYQNGQS